MFSLSVKEFVSLLHPQHLLAFPCFIPLLPMIFLNEIVFSVFSFCCLCIFLVLFFLSLPHSSGFFLKGSTYIYNYNFLFSSPGEALFVFVHSSFTRRFLTFLNSLLPLITLYLHPLGVIEKSFLLTSHISFDILRHHIYSSSLILLLLSFLLPSLLLVPFFLSFTCKA